MTKTDPPGPSAGPLDSFLAGYSRFLLGDLRYVARAAERQVRLFVLLGSWMEANDVAVGQLEEHTPVFVSERLGHERCYFVSARAVQPIHRYLRLIGVLLPRVEPQETVASDILQRFGDYLAGERGVVPGTATKYLRVAERFIAARPPDDLLGTLDAAEVCEFVRVGSEGRSGCWTSDLVCGLRSFLRFACLSGLTVHDLSSAVPSVASRADVFLPRGVDDATVRALLASCDRRRLTGRRDFAILMLLSRLGLRCGEVRAIRLEDVRWRAGEIVVRGKGNMLESLPLPAAVGEAIVSYLELRGNGRSERTLFLGVRAPHEELTSTAISVIVHRACDRAGVARIGAHRLRHTVATEMLAQGSPLAEVAMVLRQRSVRTTARYARVDHRALRAVARAWPCGHVGPITGDAAKVAGLARPWPNGVRP